MRFVLRLALSTLAVLGLAHFLEGVHVNPIEKAVIVALVISLLNTLVRPILVILTIPITVLTLGLFLLAINAGMVLLADALIDGFSIGTSAGFGNKFMWALAFSVLLSIAQGILYRLFGVKGKAKRKKKE